MLAIRLQRTGRKGHAQFRVIVQDAHRSPSSGKVVKYLGSYDPHTKVVIVDKEKASHFLEHGAQPSPRVAYLLNKEGVKLPNWVKLETNRTKSIRHTDKLRRNQPEQPKEEAPAEPEAAETEATTEEPAVETPADTPEAEASTAEADEPAETPADEPAATETPDEPGETAEAEAPADETK